jgi:hypothetical protein
MGIITAKVICQHGGALAPFKAIANAARDARAPNRAEVNETELRLE